MGLEGWDSPPSHAAAVLPRHAAAVLAHATVLAFQGSHVPASVRLLERSGQWSWANPGGSAEKPKETTILILLLCIFQQLTAYIAPLMCLRCVLRYVPHATDMIEEAC